MKNIKLIVGLANPIIKYNKTRHNVGSWFVQNLARFYNQILRKNKKFLGYTGFFFSNFKKKVYLFIPNVFMNINARSIMLFSKFYQIALNEILVVHDELDLNPGKVRLKLGFGHNGHNGIRNIIDMFPEKSSFLRIQIGIGRPHQKEKVSDFVLSSPFPEEKFLIEKSICNAINMVHSLINS
ncbi:MAG: aminoacyl-tRNA hydrolase [Buchnera aphidicola (Nurudea yanoniella)]